MFKSCFNNKLQIIVYRNEKPCKSLIKFEICEVN